MYSVYIIDRQIFHVEEAEGFIRIDTIRLRPKFMPSNLLEYQIEVVILSV